MTLELRHALLLAFASIMLGSCGIERDACPQLCAALSRCGMLPSVLGADDSLSGVFDAPASEKNCRSQCRASAESRYDPTVICANLLIDESVDDPTREWCSAGLCDELATCMRGVFDDDRVSGFGLAELSVGLGEVTKVEGLGCGPDAELDPPSCRETLSTLANDEVKDWCALSGVETLSLALESDLHSIEIEAPTSCVEGMAGIKRSDEVLVGLYRVVARLQLEGQCRTVYGEQVMVSAGPWCRCLGTHDCHGELVLPSLDTLESLALAPGCEHDMSSCTNTIDDDGDGAIDCGDPSCAGYCD